MDNYVYATYSFKYGGNGPEIERLCRNNWDLIFGNGPTPDAFDVSMVTDDRSRIKDLGQYNWRENFLVPKLVAYEGPEAEPSVKAVVGHMYLVHIRDTDSNHYVLFRVERLEPEKSVEISWKLMDPARAILRRNNASPTNDLHTFDSTGVPPRTTAALRGPGRINSQIVLDCGTRENTDIVPDSICHP